MRFSAPIADMHTVLNNYTVGRLPNRTPGED